MGSLVIVLVCPRSRSGTRRGLPMTTLAPLRPKRVPRATGTDAATGNDRDSTCEVELTIGQSKGEATIQTGPRSCLLVPRSIFHRTETIRTVEGLLEPVLSIQTYYRIAVQEQQAVHRRRAAELLIDVQRHDGMNFPNCVFLWFSSSVGTIRRRVIDIEKGHACDRDYVLLAEFEPLGCFETERKALRRPAKNKLPKLAPLGTDRNFGTNTSRFLPVGIFELESNVTICFDFYANEVTSEVIPFLFSRDSRIRLGRQWHIRLRRFPLVNLRWRN